MSDEFCSKASAAVSAVFELNPAEAKAKELAEETPKIESAVKAFLSLAMARSMAGGADTVSGNAGVLGKCFSATKGNHGIKQIQLQNKDDFRQEGSRGRNAHRISKIVENAFVGQNHVELGPKDALALARVLLRSINEHRISDLDGNHSKDDVEKDKVNHGDSGDTFLLSKESRWIERPPLENHAEIEPSTFHRKVIELLWNGIVDSGQKPSRILGRTALKFAYPHILSKARSKPPRPSPSISDQQCIAFFEEFGMLLFRHGRDGEDVDSDSALLWDDDRGFRELARRRERRKVDADGRKAMEALSSSDSNSKT